MLDRVSELRHLPPVEFLPLASAHGRVLANTVYADRSYPPLPRSIRDGFAVLSSAFEGEAEIIGEVRAGERFTGSVQPGQTVEIMTGAPLPAGTNAVIMVEYTEILDNRMRSSKRPEPGEFVSAAGSEACAGQIVLEAGERLNYSRLAVLATVGMDQVPVYPRPKVAIVATGDEIVEVASHPAEYQVRNSNSFSLAAQVQSAGGEPIVLEPARDNEPDTSAKIERALQADLVLLSGGVSAGKYDVVEKVLAALGAEFYFDRARIQPGQPVVFGHAQGKCFFGLPGNPASTMVTFKLFAQAAVELLGGAREASLAIFQAELQTEIRQKSGLTRFLPARLDPGCAKVRTVTYRGSGDVFGLARANAFVIAREDRESYKVGDLIEVLPQ